MANVKLTNVKKIYGKDTVAVHDFNLDIADDRTGMGTLDEVSDACKEAVFMMIPQILPGIITGFLLAITLSLDDYVISAYTKPHTFQTISTHIYSLNKGGMVNTIKSSYWAFTAIVFFIIVIVLIVSNVLAYRKERSKK